MGKIMNLSEKITKKTKTCWLSQQQQQQQQKGVQTSSNISKIIQQVLWTSMGIGTYVYYTIVAIFRQSSALSAQCHTYYKVLLLILIYLNNITYAQSPSLSMFTPV